MAKNKVQKGEMLRGIEAKIGKAKSIIFAGFNSLGVKENDELRGRLRKENSEYLVTKKTLLNLAMKKSEAGEFDARNFDGQVAAVFGYEDEVAPAKILSEFMKKNEGKVSLLGGVLENKILSAEDVSRLAKLPSKEELYAKVVGSLNAPISGFVNALAGNIRNLVSVLNNIKEKKA